MPFRGAGHWWLVREVFHLDVLLSGISLLTTYKQPWLPKANKQAPIKAEVLSAVSLRLNGLKESLLPLYPGKKIITST